MACLPTNPATPLNKATLEGVYFALTAYLFWGVVPVYFKWIDHVSPLEILSHRVVWAVVLLLGILAYTGELQKLKVPFRQVPILCITSVLLSSNWLVFIYAIVNNNITETSLGYYINPLVSVFLGVVFLGERLRPLQWIAIGIAGIGITIQLAVFGEVPWVALMLASSFGLYGLLRKNLGMHPIAGLAIETMMIAPLAAGFIVWTFFNGDLIFGTELSIDFLLILGGFVTSFPLLCFAAAVTRLSLTAMGMFQYVAPSIGLLLAVFYYGEPFDLARGITFGFIWLALVVFTTETWLQHRKQERIH